MKLKTMQYYEWEDVEKRLSEIMGDKFDADELWDFVSDEVNVHNGAVSTFYFPTEDTPDKVYGYENKPEIFYAMKKLMKELNVLNINIYFYW